MHIPIGVDPASGKETCTWLNNSCEFIKPQDVRPWLEHLFRDNDKKYIIAWDAPISFSDSSYSDRLIDKVSRRWVKNKVQDKVIEKKL